jgi:hypothetical protein
LLEVFNEERFVVWVPMEINDVADQMTSHQPSLVSRVESPEPEDVKELPLSQLDPSDNDNQVS